MYLLSIAAIFVCLIILCAISGGSLLSALRLFDVPSLLMLLILSVPVAISSGTAKELVGAFPLALGKKRASSFSQLKRAGVAVETAIRSLNYSALLIALFNIVLALRTLDSLEQLGPRVAAVVMTPAFALFFDLLLLPIKAKLAIREIEFMQ